MPEILRVTTRTKWEQAVAEGEYRGDTLATEGFGHFSTSKQLPWVAETYYKGQAGLVVLRIDTEKRISIDEQGGWAERNLGDPHLLGLRASDIRAIPSSPSQCRAGLGTLPTNSVLATDAGDVVEGIPTNGDGRAIER